MAQREGSLEAPTRHPIDWQNPEFYNEEKLMTEMERVFDICHGCRRCVSLCQAFPTLFDLVDESDTMEIDGVDKRDYWKVVDHCYLCDLCFLTKCPYVPPHEWNLDFPHLMLNAKAVQYKKQGVKFRDKILSATDTVPKLAGIPIVAGMVNAMNQNSGFRKILEKTLGVDQDAVIPKYHSRSLRKRARFQSIEPQPSEQTTGKVALFATCYGNHNQPDMGEDLIAVFEHNGIAMRLAEKERCCGMPKLELGDLQAVAEAKAVNIPVLAKLVDEGWDIVAPIPSCVLMFKQELPLMFPDDEQVAKVQAHIFDPFEYLSLRHKAGLLKTDFKQPLGKVAYQVACHQRVQRIGMKTRELLQLVPDTEIEMIERCSGHDGTYAVKKEFHAASMKIVRPVANRIKKFAPDYITSDCIMAGHHIAHAADLGKDAVHPLTLLKIAYGI